MAGLYGVRGNRPDSHDGDIFAEPKPFRIINNLRGSFLVRKLLGRRTIEAAG